MKITAEAISEFCNERPVDIRLAAASAPYTVCLHGEFNGHGDFFSIMIGDVEYLDIAGGFLVAGIVKVDFLWAKTVSGKWNRLNAEYSGPAIVAWSADELDVRNCADAERFLVVANTIECFAGGDWPEGSHPG